MPTPCSTATSTSRTATNSPEGYQLKGPAVASYALDNLSYGNAIWKDANGDGVITTDDKTIIGDAYPDFTGGFSTSLSWNGLDFSASFAYSYGGEVINFQDYYLYNMEGSGNQYSIVADRYISDAQPGRNNVPIASRISTTNTSLKLSSYYVEDASFFAARTSRSATRCPNAGPASCTSPRAASTSAATTFHHYPLPRLQP